MDTDQHSICLIQLALAHSHLVPFPVKHVSTHYNNDLRGYPCHHISGHFLEGNTLFL